ncbi:host specificity factor TipJ family phage tail protein [Pectobacterium versatile]|uniref:host specificity factor TipJ family phage tail protein n=1 Tax=Pectobacterium versatile TaxID=2488639 RepID=UPI0030179EE9
MTIRIYPSRLPGEPLETHIHGTLTLHDWFLRNVRGWQFEMTHPIVVEINGAPIHPAQWQRCVIYADDDIRMYPIPYGLEAATLAWIAVAVAVASVAYSLIMMSNIDTSGYSQTGSGDPLELNPAKANSAKLGDPIREIFGRYKVWPDYVVPPVSRFIDKKKYYTHLFLCVGAGDHSIPRSGIKIGATPISSFGDDVQYTIYPPGADVSADVRSENWYNAPEVGGTNAGTAGLDLGSSGPETTSVNADAVTVSGTSISLTGETAESNPGIPESWEEGTIIYVRAPDDFNVSTVSGYNVISGPLDELAPYVGMPVILDYNDKDFSLFIASFSPAEEADPDDDLSVSSPAKITLAYGSATGAAFNGIPTGTQRLTIGTSDFRYRITEIDGVTISVVRVIDVTTTITDPDTGEETTTKTTEIDPSWTGFIERTMLDASVTGLNDEYNWLGPYMACPDSEATNQFEINFAFTSGLCSYDNKGNKGWAGVTVAIQYRVVGDDDWTDKSIHYSDASEDAVGFTEVFDVPVAGQIEVRCRRATATAGGSTRDLVYWQSLRSLLPRRPTSYAGITTIALTVRTGNRIAAQSDRRVSVIATRSYGRKISGAIYHVLHSLGVTDDEIDHGAIDELEENYWTPRGETFDWAAGESSTSALEVLQKITGAGMGYFLLSDGMMSSGREGIKPWIGAITPQEMTEPMQTAFSAPSEDDYDGVDVTYINGTTWAEETVQCRTEDNPTPRKVEDYKLDGVLEQDRAYRIGMRRLMAYRHQRLTHTTTTELDALCYEYKDRIILTDDIPGSNTISCLITEMHYHDDVITLTVSEPLDWAFENPRVLIRHQDGSASALLTPTRIDDYVLTVANSDALAPSGWIMDDPCIEPPRLIFCSSSRVGYDAIIDSIEPDSDGTCGVTAKQYTPLLYQYDDAMYPGDTDNTSDD